MDLRGDPEGIQALKAVAAADKAYLKFLLTEAQSNSDLSARFTAGWFWSYPYVAKHSKMRPVMSTVAGSSMAL